MLQFTTNQLPRVTEDAVVFDLEPKEPKAQVEAEQQVEEQPKN